MAGTEDELQAHCDLLLADLAATLSADYSSRVHSCARVLRDFPGAALGARLFEEIQQQVHDEQISTTWPTCPLHHTHPLWVRDGQWVCEQTGQPLAPLGQLGHSNKP
jgi:hypothetical protein